MERLHCPVCKCGSELAAQAVVRVSFVNWPALLLAVCSIAFLGAWLQFASLETTIFATLAAIPLSTSFSRRYICRACGTHFSPAAAELETKV